MDQSSTQSEEVFADWHHVARRVLAATSGSAGKAPKVIGVSGSQGSGKSTLAKFSSNTYSAAVPRLKRYP